MSTLDIIKRQTRNWTPYNWGVYGGAVMALFVAFFVFNWSVHILAVAFGWV